MDCKSIICDANNLYEAYLKAIKGSKWKETTQKFALNYLRNIFKLIDELSKQTYLSGEEGKFTLNERGKIRAITTLQPRDRLELLSLFKYDKYLDWLLTVIFDNFKVDVSYMTDKDLKACIYDVFNRLEYRKIPKELKTGKIFMEKSLNIGDQLSQIVGVYYPNRIDTYVKFVRSIKYYGRYMDDFYIISNSKKELASVFDGIVKIANELGIHMNMKKTHIGRLDKVNKYLQVKYTLTDTGHLIKRINPKRVTKMRQKLKGLKRKLDCGETTYEAIEEMFRSWMGSFYKIMSKAQRSQLIKMFEDLFDKNVMFRKQSSKWKMIVQERR